MGKYLFSESSQRRLVQVHKDLVMIAHRALETSDVDFAITQGYRSPEEQKRLYQFGRTKPGAIVTNCDGEKKKSKHNQKPSLAIDIAPWYNGEWNWDEAHLCYLGGVFCAAYRYLFDRKILNCTYRWGGNWDGDGDIIQGQSLVDLPHHEIKVR